MCLFIIEQIELCLCCVSMRFNQCPENMSGSWRTSRWGTWWQTTSKWRMQTMGMIQGIGEGSLAADYKMKWSSVCIFFEQSGNPACCGYTNRQALLVYMHDSMTVLLQSECYEALRWLWTTVGEKEASVCGVLMLDTESLHGYMYAWVTQPVWLHRSH